MKTRDELRKLAERAADYLDALDRRPVGASVDHGRLLASLARPLPERGTPAGVVWRELADQVDGGLVASSGPRYFGFVVGGTTPAGIFADWLTSIWDQNAQCYATSPAAAVAESVVADWLLEMLGLPTDASVGFVTGCQMANFTALACARDTVLRRAGWDLEADGLFGAPELTVLMSDCAHATLRSAAGMLGLGDRQIVAIPSDSQGRLLPTQLESEIRRRDGQPLIVCLQAGNVNTGAFEPVEPIARMLRERNAWIHVDGAFGLWAAVSPVLRAGLSGVEQADSWSTDAHKWLNVPYDSGLVFVKERERHRELKRGRCAYVGAEREQLRDGSTWAPENSRRARGFALYAALVESGRSGVRETVERCCQLARKFAVGVEGIPGLRVLNEVVLNQVIFRCLPPGGVDPLEFHQSVAEWIQADGRCWLGSTTWKGGPALRCSICNRSTRASDIEIAVRTLRDAVEQVGGRLS